MQTYEKYKILLCTNRLQSAGLLIKISVHEQLTSTPKIFAWISYVQYKKEYRSFEQKKTVRQLSILCMKKNDDYRLEKKRRSQMR